MYVCMYGCMYVCYVCMCVVAIGIIMLLLTQYESDGWWSLAREWVPEKMAKTQFTDYGRFHRTHSSFKN